MPIHKQPTSMIRTGLRCVIHHREYYLADCRGGLRQLQAGKARQGKARQDKAAKISTHILFLSMQLIRVLLPQKRLQNIRLDLEELVDSPFNE